MAGELTNIDPPGATASHAGAGATHRWWLAWHPESGVCCARRKSLPELEEWRGREWRLSSAPIISEITACLFQAQLSDHHRGGAVDTALLLLATRLGVELGGCPRGNLGRIVAPEEYEFAPLAGSGRVAHAEWAHARMMAAADRAVTALVARVRAALPPALARIMEAFPSLQSEEELQPVLADAAASVQADADWQEALAAVQAEREARVILERARLADQATYLRALCARIHGEGLSPGLLHSALEALDAERISRTVCAIAGVQDPGLDVLTAAGAGDELRGDLLRRFEVYRRFRPE